MSNELKAVEGINVSTPGSLILSGVSAETGTVQTRVIGIAAYNEPKPVG